MWFPLSFLNEAHSPVVVNLGWDCLSGTNSSSSKRPLSVIHGLLNSGREQNRENIPETAPQFGLSVAMRRKQTPFGVTVQVLKPGVTMPCTNYIVKGLSEFVQAEFLFSRSCLRRFCHLYCTLWGSSPLCVTYKWGLGWESIFLIVKGLMWILF